MSSFTVTQTQTYTVADIAKVIDCVAADLDMMSQSTGLLTRDEVIKAAADVKLLAQKGYLLEANIVLQNAGGEVIRAAKYEVSTDAATLKAQRPGNNLWPKTPGGDLTVVVQYSRHWFALTDAQRAAFNRELASSWTTSNTDLSFPGLARSSDRSYSSNGWGVTKTVYR
jgi:Bacterial HORMA domain family 1